jgi:hypothetical protein
VGGERWPGHRFGLGGVPTTLTDAGDGGGDVNDGGGDVTVRWVQGVVDLASASCERGRGRAMCRDASAAIAAPPTSAARDRRSLRPRVAGALRLGLSPDHVARATPRTGEGPSGAAAGEE